MYSRAHDLPLVASTLGGLRAMVVSLIANAVVSFGAHTLRRGSHAAIALGAAALFGAGVNPLIVIGLAAAAGWALVRPEGSATIPPEATPAMPPSLGRLASILAIGACGLVVLAVADRQLAALFVLMLRIDLFAFGGGFASVPLLYHEVVEVRHWLTGPTLLDGVALGQVTPGPIVITAAFVGHQLAGVIGGTVATIGMFLPSFLMVVGVAPYFDRLRRSSAVAQIVAGVLCSFVGLLLTVAIRFAQEVDWSWAHGGLAIAAFVALRCRVNVLWVVVGGILLSAVLGR
jgi:chromate transporter